MKQGPQKPKKALIFGFWLGGTRREDGNSNSCFSLVAHKVREASSWPGHSELGTRLLGYTTIIFVDMAS